VSGATRSARGPDPFFTSYVPLAIGLVGDLTGICLLDGSLRPRGNHGELAGAATAKWIRSLAWSELNEPAPAASAFGSHQWWTGIPLKRSDGTLIGVFCVSQSVASAPAQPSRFAADLALRLKPLLDCIHRDLTGAVTVNSMVRTLTQRSAELEWLFKVTSNLKGGVDDKKILQELVAEATSRLNSALGILYVPDKHLTVKYENDKDASTSVLEAWAQTRDHLITWVQRQRSPLVVNSAGREGKGLPRCKVLCVPVVREAGRVIGLLAFYNLPTAANYSNRQTFLARHIGLQAASIVEAQFDLMTGLYTRSGLDQVYCGLLDKTELIESSVIYLDIDHMHVANEQHGFELGNELIVRIADLLSAPLLPDDALAARISGDRFAIVLPRATSADAVKIAEALQTAASQLVIGPVKEGFDVSISCGICGLVPVPEELARAIAAAEMACKSAKKHGGRSVKLYVFEDGSMMRRHADTLAVGQLRSALKADRLLLYAQRIAPLQNPSLPGGYELLLRLRDEDGSLVSPGPLIDAARRYQLLPTIDRWVMQRALQMLAPYRGMLRSRGLGMSINLSGQSICDEAFIQHFTQALKDAKLPRHSVSVELTEQAAITNLASAAKMVTRLGAFGCQFAMDDFGTGANSLTYLKALQVYRVKIDGSFVRDIQSDRNSKATVSGIVELAKGLGIETVAEYVENKEIAQEVRRLGVDYAQGYAFGKPAPLEEVLESLAQDESKSLLRLFLET